MRLIVWQVNSCCLLVFCYLAKLLWTLAKKLWTGVIGLVNNKLGQFRLNTGRIVDSNWLLCLVFTIFVEFVLVCPSDACSSCWHKFAPLQVLSLHRRWEVYRGDSTDSKDILFTVKKSHILQLKTELEVFLPSNTSERHYDFKLKGSWFEKACTIYAGNHSNVIAQVFSNQSQRLSVFDSTNPY